MANEAFDLETFSDRDLLSHVDAAIQNILTRADLGLLRQMRKELLAQENAGDGCLLPGTVAAFFEGR